MRLLTQGLGNQMNKYKAADKVRGVSWGKKSGLRPSPRSGQGQASHLTWHVYCSAETTVIVVKGARKKQWQIYFSRFFLGDVQARKGDAPTFTISKSQTNCKFKLSSTAEVTGRTTNPKWKDRQTPAGRDGTETLSYLRPVQRDVGKNSLEFLLVCFSKLFLLRSHVGLGPRFEIHFERRSNSATFRFPK